jgi:hypothetical protein
MSGIKPGPELDQAVAKAIGATLFAGKVFWELDGKPLPEALSIPEMYRPLSSGQMLPYFSTDLNAAFAAAEKVGLFQMQGGDHCVLCQQGPLWIIHTIEDEGICVSERTPALAICAAILILRADCLRDETRRHGRV